MPILRVSQGSLPVPTEWAYMTKGVVMVQYAYLIAFILFAFWLILIMAKANERLGEILDELRALNGKLKGPVKGKG